MSICKIGIIIILSIIVLQFSSFAEDKSTAALLQGLPTKKISLAGNVPLEQQLSDAGITLGVAYKMLGISFMSYKKKISIIEYAYYYAIKDGFIFIIGKVDGNGVFDASSKPLKLAPIYSYAKPIGISDNLLLDPLSPAIIYFNHKGQYIDNDAFVGLTFDYKLLSIELRPADYLH